MSFSWSEDPVFCFTSDVDWASEEVLKYSHRALSGESLGRCTWWFVETDNERIIHPGVHRGITGNVNSSDIVYRSQVLR